AVEEMMLTGDHRADAERLFQKYARGVGSYVLGRVRDAELAEAITARVFLTVVHRIADCRGSASAWLWTIVRNEVTRHFRDQKPQQPLDENHPDPTDSPPEQLAKQETQTKLMAVLEELPEAQREIIYMKYFLDMRNKDVAAALNMTASNVGVQVHRALKELRKRLDSTRPAGPIIQQEMS
ncbi:MAG: sigma-70 family RNA polymerase sigma factor, partial [Planctomycetales bacterium]